MPGADAWVSLADEVVARGDAALVEAAGRALGGLPLADDERAALLVSTQGRVDRAAQLLVTVAETAPAGRPAPLTPPLSPPDMDAAITRSRDVLAGPPDELAARLSALPPRALSALPPDAAGAFVTQVADAAAALSSPGARTSVWRALLVATEGVTLVRVPVAAVLRSAVSAPLTDEDATLVGALLARVPTARLVSGVLDAVRGGSDPRAALSLLQRAAEQGRPPGPPAPAAPPPRPAFPPSAAWGAPSAPGPAPTASRSPWRPRWPWSRDRSPSQPPAPPPSTVWRGGHAAERDLAPAPGDQAPGGVLRAAYPLIDVDAHRDVRPDVVVVDEPFDVTVGLSKFQDTTLTQTGALHFMAGASTEVELILVYDPSSLTAQGSTRLTLTVSDATPYPSATVPFVAQYRPDLPPERRIGVHYVVDGQVVGIAWRSLVAVPQPKDVAGAPTPPSGPDRLLDLQPLLGVDQPDLVLSICASDGAATGEFVWTAYAGGDASAVTVPDAPRSSSLESDLQSFVTDLRQAVAQSKGTFGDFLTVQGKATRMGRAVPDGIAQVLRDVVQQPGRTRAPSVLLLTEEVTLPWELAVLDPPLDSAWGGLSPFLGAHAAIARWPLSEKRPRPTPRSSVAVRRAAVLTADYTGVMGWGQLTDAQDEAATVRTLFEHAVPVAPSLRDVVNLFSGNPPADVVHVALHGQFDAQGDEGGLVLLATDAEGRLTTRPLFLTPDQVLTGSLDDGPFVFLNACQVGADKRVLADNGGFASTLLQIGATGVVAPLWNVNDTTAAAFAEDFYAATWPPAGDARTPVPAAEAVRALRARYTRPAAEAQTPGVDATLVAFQVFGHPRLRLDRG